MTRKLKRSHSGKGYWASNFGAVSELTLLFVGPAQVLCRNYNIISNFSNKLVATILHFSVHYYTSIYYSEFVGNFFIIFTTNLY